MRKVLGLGVAFFLVLGPALGAGSAAAGPEYGMGCNMPAREAAAAYPRAAHKRTAGLPEKADWSSMFPAPGHQGAQGSCVGWAIGYAMMSFYRQPPEGPFSPSYIYNQINGGVDGGAYIEDAAELLFTHGACPLRSMPYDASDWKKQPAYAQHRESLRYKASGWGCVTGVSQIKAYLAEGYAVALSLPAYDNFCGLSAASYVYDRYAGALRGRHAVCLTGYDDSVGAFKFINSWGIAWGAGGYAYISYKLVSDNLYPDAGYGNRTTIFAYLITDRKGAHEGDDYGDTFANAYDWPISADSINSVEGRFETPGFANAGLGYTRTDIDMFAFAAPEDGTLRVWSSGSTVNVIGAIYDSRGSQVAKDYANRGGGDEFLFECRVARGGVYYIECKPRHYTAGAYTLCAAYADSPEPVPTAAHTPPPEPAATNSPTAPAERSRVLSVAAAQKTVYLKKGTAAALAVAAITSDGSRAKLAWKSSAPKIVSVDKNGKAAARKAGAAVITAEAGNGKRAKITVRVGGKPPQSVSVANRAEAKSMIVGETLLLRATVKPRDARGVLIYRTSDAKVLSVDAAGRLRALSKGSALVTIALENKRAAVIVRVRGGR